MHEFLIKFKKTFSTKLVGKNPKVNNLFSQTIFLLSGFFNLNYIADSNDQERIPKENQLFTAVGLSELSKLVDSLY